MTIKEIKQKYYQKIDLLDLELIISRVIKRSREFVIAHPEFKIITNYELQITNYAEHRMRGEPLAYIYGEKEFYGLKFKINKNVLIPRPETEMMVDEAIKQLTINNPECSGLTIIDVGAGSGCIIITLAKLLKNLKIIKFKDYKIYAIDISKPALKIARQNAKLHKVEKKIKFFHGNLLEPILNKPKFDICNSTFVILANLPYLTPAQIKNSSSIKYEPRLALTAGRDGLKYYRELFKQTKKLITDSRQPVTALCEIDPGQTKKIKEIIKKNLPQAKTEIKKDLGGRNRIVVVEL